MNVADLLQDSPSDDIRTRRFDYRDRDRDRDKDTIDSRHHHNPSSTTTTTTTTTTKYSPYPPQSTYQSYEYDANRYSSTNRTHPYGPPQSTTSPAIASPSTSGPPSRRSPVFLSPRPRSPSSSRPQNINTSGDAHHSGNPKYSKYPPPPPASAQQQIGPGMHGGYVQSRHVSPSASLTNQGSAQVPAGMGSKSLYPTTAAIGGPLSDRGRERDRERDRGRERERSRDHERRSRAASLSSSSRVDMVPGSSPSQSLLHSQHNSYPSSTTHHSHQSSASHSPVQLHSQSSYFTQHREHSHGPPPPPSVTGQTTTSHKSPPLSLHTAHQYSHQNSQQVTSSTSSRRVGQGTGSSPITGPGMGSHTTYGMGAPPHPGANNASGISASVASSNNAGSLSSLPSSGLGQMQTQQISAGQEAGLQAHGHGHGHGRSTHQRMSPAMGSLRPYDHDEVPPLLQSQLLSRVSGSSGSFSQNATHGPAISVSASHSPHLQSSPVHAQRDRASGRDKLMDKERERDRECDKLRERDRDTISIFYESGVKGGGILKDEKDAAEREKEKSRKMRNAGANVEVITSGQVGQEMDMSPGLTPLQPSVYRPGVGIGGIGTGGFVPKEGREREREERGRKEWDKMRERERDRERDKELERERERDREHDRERLDIDQIKDASRMGGLPQIIGPGQGPPPPLTSSSSSTIAQGPGAGTSSVGAQNNNLHYHHVHRSHSHIHQQPQPQHQHTHTHGHTLQNQHQHTLGHTHPILHTRTSHAYHSHPTSSSSSAKAGDGNGPTMKSSGVLALAPPGVTISNTSVFTNNNLTTGAKSGETMQPLSQLPPSISHTHSHPIHHHHPHTRPGSPSPMASQNNPNVVLPPPPSASSNGGLKHVRHNGAYGSSVPVPIGPGGPPPNLAAQQQQQLLPQPYLHGHQPHGVPTTLPPPPVLHHSLQPPSHTQRPRMPSPLPPLAVAPVQQQAYHYHPQTTAMLAQQQQQYEAPRPREPPIHLGKFVYPRMPFPFFFPAKSREWSRDRETHVTILIPTGFLPSAHPKPRQLRIWGGGISIISNTWPTDPSGRQFRYDRESQQRRVYTDDSDILLCALHCGKITWRGIQCARRIGQDLRVELVMRRQARYVGGPSAAVGDTFDVGLQEDAVEDGGSGPSREEDFSVHSAAWGNGHDGSGIEVLSAEWVSRGTAHSLGLRNRSQRMLEYSKRRHLVVDDEPIIPPPLFSEQREICPPPSRASKFPELPVGEDEEEKFARKIVLSFGAGVSSDRVGFKYEAATVKTLLFPPPSTVDVPRRRKRRKLNDINSEGHQSADIMEVDDEDSMTDSISLDKPQRSLLLENDEERFVFNITSQHHQPFSDDDKENRTENGVNASSSKHEDRYDIYTVSKSTDPSTKAHQTGEKKNKVEQPTTVIKTVGLNGVDSPTKSTTKQIIEVLNPQVLTRQQDIVKVVSRPDSVDTEKKTAVTSATVPSIKSAKSQSRRPSEVSKSLTATTDTTNDSAKILNASQSFTLKHLQKLYSDIGHDDLDFREKGVVILRGTNLAANDPKQGLFIRVQRWKWIENGDLSSS